MCIEIFCFFIFVNIAFFCCLFVYTVFRFFYFYFITTIAMFCCLFIYALFSCLFDEVVLEIQTSDSSALFEVANRFEKLYGGKVYVGLRIPDADTGSRQNVDMALVTEGDAVVISVKNLSGTVSSGIVSLKSGSWNCESGNKHQTERLPDPVMETKKQASILESYLEQRGVALPEGYFSCKVVLPNPNLRDFPFDVITYNQWVQQKPEPNSMFSGRLNGASRGGKKEMPESLHQKLNFILRTAPMWDRLELEGNKYVLGEFLEFKGELADIWALKNIKRSKVSHLIIKNISLFGSTLQVLYSPRDYRSEGTSDSEWKKVTVRSSTEVFFRLENSTKVRKSKLSSIISLSLTA
ncbi:hypothetical protein I3760_06G033700 [Carya illinoinensis]|uniref:NERD domain-containing protein n=1 Tax=Carya illinoinensis TaxID=32201 RepID=A0A8T1Q7D7_CARIL|nr:hypothetical protein I3760_06G033700 [Carya illinoinensis]KAG2701199.1 hypothetical protein I3760_06G033700 [Carya illinoinensis]KAG6650326.1 hypothetical protein CIPAW_06G035000 [Carya illinoinensis]